MDRTTLVLLLPVIVLAGCADILGQQATASRAEKWSQENDRMQCNVAMAIHEVTGIPLNTLGVTKESEVMAPILLEPCEYYVSSRRQERQSRGRNTSAIGLNCRSPTLKALISPGAGLASKVCRRA
jgi:hypothetical protein